MPVIQIVDLREQTKQKLMDGHFSKTLLLAVGQALEKREQVILFQNRRGFVPWINCQNCGHVPHCINCDITLTYHKSKQELRCHYCGYIDHQYNKCEKCASYEIKQVGIGTEKIEEEIKAHFPEARVARMDHDTTRSRTAFLKFIRSLERHEIDPEGGRAIGRQHRVEAEDVHPEARGPVGVDAADVPEADLAEDDARQLAAIELLLHPLAVLE